MSWTKEDVVEVALKHGISTAKEICGLSKEQIEEWVKDEIKKTVDEVVFSNPTESKVVLYTTEEKTLEKIHELMNDSHNMENKNIVTAYLIPDLVIWGGKSVSKEEYEEFMQTWEQEEHKYIEKWGEGKYPSPSVLSYIPMEGIDY